MATRHFYSTETRQKLANDNTPMENSDFAINNVNDLVDAVHAFDRAKNPEIVKGWILDRAKDLGSMDAIPEEWLEKAKSTTPWSAAKKDKMAENGEALPDGSFGISNKHELQRAYVNLHLAKDKAKAKAHIIKRARALDAMDVLPEGFSKGGEDVVTIDGKERKDLETKPFVEKSSNPDDDDSELINAGLAVDANPNEVAREIGQTKSGKPIYDVLDHSSYTGFTSDDHYSAGRVHFGYETYYKGIGDTVNEQKHKSLSDGHHAKQYEMEASKMNKE